MPIKIYKYPLQPEVLMHATAKILSVQVQHNEAFIWAEVDIREPLRVFNFTNRVTGSAPPIGGRYLGTIQFNQGDFVIHVYRV